MKCPYACNVTQVNQRNHQYEDNIETFTEHKMLEKKTYLKCEKENCAVWHNEKCNYGEQKC